MIIAFLPDQNDNNMIGGVLSPPTSQKCEVSGICILRNNLSKAKVHRLR